MHRFSGKNDHVPINIKSSDPEEDHEEPSIHFIISCIIIFLLISISKGIRQRPIASLVPVTQQNFVSQRVVRAANFLDTMR